MPSFETVAPLVLGAHQLPNVDCELVAFVGPMKSFTKTVMRNVEEEIADIAPLRFDTIQDYLDSVDLTKQTTRIVVVDSAICDPELKQLDALFELSEALPAGAEAPGVVIAYCNDHCAQAVVEALGDASQVQGFLPMNQSIDIWLAVLRLFLSGGSYYPPEIMGLNQTMTELKPVQAEPKSAAKPAPVAEKPSVEPDILTPREVAVMKHVSSGLQNKQIAGELGVSEHTIKLHIHHIITKLNVSNRTAAAMKFMEVMQH